MEAAGGPACSHTNLAKEYDLGGQTGDKGCLDCGEAFSLQELAEMGKKAKGGQ
ncbi:hypothetical protein [Streptomyces sp. NPDC056188]|uniref:hypothetical protein n=1 Tax=Streptomyces sp. NPDC056188 TaxID=3345740 RepID=UPI0035D97454